MILKKNYRKFQNNWMDWSKITTEQIKSFLAVITVLSVIIGYFYGIVSSEIFYTTVGSIITHFYQGTKVKELSDKIEQQNIELQSLRNG